MYEEQSEVFTMVVSRIWVSLLEEEDVSGVIITLTCGFKWKRTVPITGPEASLRRISIVGLKNPWRVTK